MRTPSPQANFSVSMSFTVCAIRSPTFLCEKKSKCRLWRCEKNSFLSDCSILRAAPIMKYLQKNLKTDMAKAMKSKIRPYFDISPIPAPSTVRASTTFSMIKGMESWHRSTRDSARRPARKEYLYFRSREKRVFFFIHRDHACGRNIVIQRPTELLVYLKGQAVFTGVSVRRRRFRSDGVDRPTGLQRSAPSLTET